MGDEKLYNDVHNYTKFKLVEMLINRLNDGRTKVDDMNSIEDLAEKSSFLEVSYLLIYDATPEPITVFKVDPDELTISNVEELFIILPLTTSVAPVVNIVPVSFGMVIVLSAVGSTTVTVVSKSSDVAPSNTIDDPVEVIEPHVKLPTVVTPAPNVPVVTRFSFPKSMSPELSVIETIKILEKLDQ